MIKEPIMCQTGHKCTEIKLYNGEIHAVCDICRTLEDGLLNDNDSVRKRIIAYLDNIDEHLKYRSDELHLIEQKQLLSQELSHEEIALYNAAEQFRNIYVDLHIIRNNHTLIDTERVRKNLYTLVMNVDNFARVILERDISANDEH